VALGVGELVGLGVSLGNTVGVEVQVGGTEVIVDVAVGDGRMTVGGSRVDVKVGGIVGVKVAGAKLGVGAWFSVALHPAMIPNNISKKIIRCNFLSIPIS